MKIDGKCLYDGCGKILTWTACPHKKAIVNKYNLDIKLREKELGIISADSKISLKVKVFDQPETRLITVPSNSSISMLFKEIETSVLKGRKII